MVVPENPEQDVPSLKRQNVTLDEDLQHKVLRWIANCHLRIRYTVAKEEFLPTMRYICLGDKVHSILCIAHRYLKQTDFKTIEEYDYRVTISRKMFRAKAHDIHAIILEEAELEGLEYKEYEAKDVDNWYHVAETCLDLLSGFALRTRELRLGHDKIMVLSHGNDVRQTPVSKYGLKRTHEMLLEGITFPPEKKISMVESMGPLTLLLAHITSRKTCAKKWTRAARRALAFVPEIDNILAATQGRPAAEVRPLVSVVAELVYLVGRRRAIRMFFSPTCFYYLCCRRKIGSVQVKPYLKGHSLGPDNVKHISSSGAGGFAFYNLMTLGKWVYEGDFTNSQAAQVFFHGTFGTYKEDFGLLESITNEKTWQTRGEMTGNFSVTSEKFVEFDPIKLVTCYNVSWVNQFKFLSQFNEEITCVSCFTGCPRYVFGDRLLIHSHLFNAELSLQDLTYYIRETFVNLCKKIIEAGPEHVWAKVDWYNVNDIKDGKYGNKLKNFVPKKSMRYFLDRTTRSQEYSASKKSILFKEHNTSEDSDTRESPKQNGRGSGFRPANSISKF